MNDSVFLKLCRRRKSVRRFADRPVEREKIELCLEAARHPPSADNVQPWRFLVFDDPQKKAELVDAIFRGAYAFSKQVAAASLGLSFQVPATSYRYPGFCTAASTSDICLPVPSVPPSPSSMTRPT